MLPGNRFCVRVKEHLGLIKYKAFLRVVGSVHPVGILKILNVQIEDYHALEFAIVILDVNDLKKINDTEGHNAGDQYIKDACKIICEIFNHSPVFRIGGDEFVVIAQGSDYNRIDELVKQVYEHNIEAKRSGGIVVACGMAKHQDEDSVAPVFERADQNMYDNKNDLKSNNL